MARYAVVENGTVTNIVEWDGSATHAESSGWVLADANAYIGGAYDGSSFAAKPAGVDDRTYAQKREAAYPSVADFMEAYTEKEIGGDSTKWDAYVTKYNTVRSDNPKP
jgi:hypothetical protein